MKLPKPSKKQIIIIIIMFIVIIVGSGFITNRKPKENTDEEKSNIIQKAKAANIRRLEKADSHLQTITQPVNIKKELAREEN